MHSLPTPVTRRSQKVYKPEFFEVFRKEKEARDAVRLTRDWLVDEDVKEVYTSRTTTSTGTDTQRQNLSARRSAQDVVLELGAILRCKDQARTGTRPPKAHRAFSHLPFVRGTTGPQGSQLSEGDDGGDAPDLYLEEDEAVKKEERDGGWLEEDDIEDC